MNAAHCISGKTNEMYNLLLGELTPRTKLVAGTLEILADGTAELDRGRGTLLGELPLSTGRAVRDSSTRSSSYTRGSNAFERKGERKGR